MKRLIILLIFSCIIKGLLTSGTAGKKPGSVFICNTAPEIKYDTTGNIGLLKVDSFNLAILPPSSGIQFYNNAIVYLSESKKEGKMLADHLSFGAVEAYYAIPEDSVLGNHLVFSPGSSFSYPCESITFSHDFNTMYFTKYSTKYKKEKIYMAKFIPEGKKQPGWQSEILPMEFCIDNFSYSHPALSADDNILIFASDMEGSFGGMDLFISRKTGADWSPAENLGNLINTKGNEFFPFLDSDNNLFFSSDRIAGYGGFDIFTCKFNGVAWDKPINLSPAINSENDDIAFTINKTDGKTAFYTRRQRTGKKEMQLFRVTLKKEVVDNNLITISVIYNGKPVLRPVSTDLKTAVIVKPVEKELAKPAKPLVMADAIKAIPRQGNENNDIVVYKVQMISSMTSKGKFQITVTNKSYDTFEYYYKQAYRYTIGEFSTPGPAVELQNTCRKSGSPQAFVVAFKNNIRSLDPALFK